MTRFFKQLNFVLVMSNESFLFQYVPYLGSTYHLMCCCPFLLVGTTNTTIIRVPTILETHTGPTKYGLNRDGCAPANGKPPFAKTAADNAAAVAAAEKVDLLVLLLLVLL